MHVIRTVLGDIPPEQMGMTYSHEHLIISGGVAVDKNPALLLNDVERSCEEVEDVKAYGIKTFIDMMPVSIGRECAKLVEISRRTGVNIIAATGFHKPMYYHPLHWIYRYSEDRIADLLCEEIETGMDSGEYLGPVVDRIQAKAGVIKVAGDYNCIKGISQKLFAAAAQAHLRAGAPIAAHTEHGTYGLEQIELLMKYGVNPERVVICHLDRNPDIGYHEEVAQTGVFLEYDNIGRIKYWPDSSTAALIREMADRGFGHKLLLGTDSALNTYWKSCGGGPGMSYLMRRFVPNLLKNGVEQWLIDKLMVINPASAFAIKIQ